MKDDTEAETPRIDGTSEGFIPGLDGDPQDVEHQSQDPDDFPPYRGQAAQRTTAKAYREQSQTFSNGYGEPIAIPRADNAAPADEPLDDEPDDAPLSPGLYQAWFLGYRTNQKHSARRQGENGPEYRGKCVVQYEIIGGDHAGRVLERHFNVWFPQGERDGSIHFVRVGRAEALSREACAAADDRVRGDRCVAAIKNNPKVWIKVGSVERDTEGKTIESFASYSTVRQIIGSVESMSESTAREKAGL